MENAVLGTPVILLGIIMFLAILWRIAKAVIRTTFLVVVTMSLVALLVVGYFWSPQGQAQTKQVASDWFEQTY